LSRKAVVAVEAENATRHSADANAGQPETALLRVLWMIAQGMVWPWLLEGLCHREMIQQALDSRLVLPPFGEHLGYHITDAGRQRIVDWYRETGPGRGAPGTAPQWRAVTLR
jgi:hypothetical protein